jgi:hypothetical protein
MVVPVAVIAPHWHKLLMASVLPQSMFRAQSALLAVRGPLWAEGVAGDED